MDFNDRIKAKKEAWKSGNLRYLLDATQREMYDAFRNDTSNEKGRIWYWNCARQIGKSFTLCVIAIEEALRRPRGQIKYASQDQKAARAIVFPQMELILKDCPDRLLPRFIKHDGVYYFPHNGSRITIAGCDGDNIRKLRGQHAHLAIVDEGAFVADLQRVVYSVLLPQTTTTEGRMLVATTPAESAGHFSTELAQLCKSKGAYAKFDIWASKRISEKEKWKLCLEYGGEATTRWRREYLCEFVTDTAGAVVPEFSDEAEKEIVIPYARPEFFLPYVSLDGGYTDAAGVLFGYVDYRNARLVIEDEWMKRGALGSDIARAVAEKENKLWQDYHAKFLTWKQEYRPLIPHLRTMDVDPEMAAQFIRNHGMVWTPVEKRPGYKQALVNQLNDFIKDRRLIISPNCVNLVRQLHNAVWQDNKRKTYRRNEQDAHYDLVDALVYMLKIADFSTNPFPEGKKDLQSNYYSPEELTGHGPKNESEQALMKAFGTGLKGVEL